MRDIDARYPIQVIMIEKVHAIHGRSAVNNFHLGYSTGLVNGIAGAIGCSMDQVSYRLWQRCMVVTKKGEAIKRRLDKWLKGSIQKLKFEVHEENY